MVQNFGEHRIYLMTMWCCCQDRWLPGRFRFPTLSRTSLEMTVVLLSGPAATRKVQEPNLCWTSLEMTVVLLSGPAATRKVQVPNLCWTSLEMTVVLLSGPAATRKVQVLNLCWTSLEMTVVLLSGLAATRKVQVPNLCWTSLEMTVVLLSGPVATRKVQVPNLCWTSLEIRCTVKSWKTGHPQKCCNYPIIGTVLFNHRLMLPEEAKWQNKDILIWSSLIWVYIVCPNLYVRNLWIILVIVTLINNFRR